MDTRSFALGLGCGVIVTAFALSTSLAVGEEAQSALGSTPKSIEGVWRVVEQTINGRTLRGDQLGLGYHIWTKGFYCAVRESDVPPRPNITDTDTASAEQLRAVWGPFVAQIGTYQLSADGLTSSTTLVAKNPSNMGTARVGRGRVRVEGGTLITEPANPNRGGRKITLKMVRVE